MTGFAVFLVFGVALLWISGAAIRRFARRHSQKQLLARLQKWFGGRFHAGNVFVRPSLLLRYGQTEARVSAGNPLGPVSAPGFQILIAWPYRSIRCEILDRELAGLQQFHTMRGAAVTVPGEFGRQFEVHADDEQEIQGLLTPGVQWQLQKLLTLGTIPHLHVSIQGGAIKIYKPWRRPRAEAVAQWVQGCLELYDQCMLAKASGIEFLHADEAQVLDQIICQICGDEIVEQMVVCRRCKTPHHAECWRYTGVCSVFGCRETVCEKPRSH